MIVDPLVSVGLRVAVIGMVGAGTFAGREGLRRWQAGRRRRVLDGEAIPEMSQGEPTVLLFSGTLCSECIRQKEALSTLTRSGPSFRVSEVMAAKDPALAGRFGVQSVPATVVLNGKGKAVAVNYGFAEAELIASQLAKGA
jgi:hypothetical protein